jgi:hypothetical protein
VNRGRGKAFVRALCVLLALSLFSFALSHPANVASAQFKIQPDGTFTGRIRFDLVAFAVNATPKDATDEAMNAFLDSNDEALKKSLADAEARFRAGFATDPSSTVDRLGFTSVADVRSYLASDPKPRVPMMMTVTVEGHLPTGSRTVAFRYPAVLDTVIQTVEIPYTEPISEPVSPDGFSSTITIPSREDIADLAATMNAPRPTVPKPQPKKVAKTAPKPKVIPTTEGVPKPAVEEPTPVLEIPKIQATVVKVLAPKAPVKVEPSPKAEPAPAPPQASPSRSSPIVTYLRMGFLHILPQGLDHILFVLGLFLLGSNTKALLKQVTAFTVAHSITLALATLNIVRVPGRITEPLIAASIAFVAIENLYLRDVKPWRTAVVFLFGLVHGMGFAEVFTNAGLRGRGLVEALLSFNVGVELGQLSVIAMAFAAIGWFRRDPSYRKWVVVPASLVIAAVALFWTVERTFGLG